MKQRQVSRLSSVAILFMILGASHAFAQEFRGTMTGTVTDPSGASVPNASIEAVNNSTEQKYSTKTTDKGVYFIPYVNPGTYTVTAGATGFNTQQQASVLIQAGQSRGLNFALQVGAASQTVEVTSAPPLIETANASGGTVLTQQEIENVPLNGRQIYMLLGTTPGSQFLQTQFGSSGYSGTRGWDVSNNYTLGGGVQGYQQFTLNGTNITMQNNGAQGTWELAPNVDALQEVNVMTTTYDARYGRTGGGTVNMVVKSGSNQFHGDAYEYFENGDLNANNFENNLNGVPRQNLHQNQFGGTFGGPIKKDKIFFFGSYEQYIEHIPFTTVTSVPPAYLRPSSGGVNFTPSGYTIYDPSTTVCTVAGGTVGNCPGNAYARTEFPNDTIPVSQINPIGAAVLNLYPLPNAGNGLQNNYIANTPDKYFYWQPMFRVDYDTSDKTRWYSMFAFQHGTEFRNSSGFPPPAENGNINTMRQELMASQDMTHIFSPTLLADFKLSFSRFLDSFPDGDLAQTVNPSSIGLNMPQIPTSTIKQLPEFSTSDGFYPQVVGNSVSNDVYNTFAFDNDWTKTFANHTFHFGGEVQELQYANPGSVGHPNGQFAFGTQYTQYNPLQRNTLSGINDGFDVADMLLGYPDSSGSGVQYNDTLIEGMPTWALYFQDDWKVNSKLTLNIGVRYDIQLGLRERYNRLNRGMCFTCVNPLTNTPQYQANLTADSPALLAAGINPATLSTVYGGLEFPGVNGNTRDAYDTDWSNIQPRFGFAYALNDRTVIRGGYGIFYTVGLEAGTQDGFSVTTPYTSSTNGNVTPTSYFASGNPFPSGYQVPPGNSLGLETNLGNGYSIDFPGRRIPRSQEVSLGFQRELPGQIVLDARYAGNFTDRLRVFVWDNGTMSYATLQQGIADPTLFNEQVPNPYYNVPGIPASSSCGTQPTISRINLLLPLSQYCGLIGQYNDPLGKNFYNGLEVKLNKRLSRGLSFQISYTFSKTMQATGYENGWPYQDPNLKYEISPSDRTHVFTATSEWALPIGKESSLGILPNASGVLGAFVNSWNIDFILSAETGTPVGLNTGYYDLCNHSYAPNGGSTLSNYLYNDYSSGNPLGCWSTIPQYGLMTLPNQISQVRNPSITNLDIALHKDFAITEHSRIQFRAEAMNATNTVLFPGPDTNPGDGPPKVSSNGNYSGFGTVNLYQQNFPRILQFAFKYIF